MLEQNFFMSVETRLPRDKHKMALDVPYKIFVQDGGFTLESRRSAIERVCLPMLRLVQVHALTEFFLDHIKEIMEHIEAKPAKVSDNLTVKHA